MKPLSSREFLKTPHQRWEKQGKFVPQRTLNGHRRYDINQKQDKKLVEELRDVAQKLQDQAQS